MILFDNLLKVVRFIVFSFFFEIWLCEMLNNRGNLFLCFVFLNYEGSNFVGRKENGEVLVIKYWKVLVFLFFFVCMDNMILFGIMNYEFV